MPPPNANLTKFPNLYSALDNAGESRNGPGQYVLGDIRQPAEVLICAWATLLRAYTGEEQPVFLVDDRVVSVDPSAQKIEDVSVTKPYDAATWISLADDNSGVHVRSRSASSLSSNQQSYPTEDSSTASNSSFELVERNSLSLSSPDGSSPERSSLALALFHAEDPGSLRIESFGAVPSTHLPEIGRQLHCILQHLTSPNENDLVNDENETKLSIINPFPETVEGPRLLHDLSFCHGLSEDIALDFRGKDHSRTTLSYRALRQHSLYFATQLRKCHELRPNEQFGVVPVLIPQSPELYVALLAILKLGAAFCPLQLDTPEDRIKFIFNDVDARVVATTVDGVAKLKNIPGIKCCIIDTVDRDPVDVPEESLNDLELRQPSPHDPAYIMYTSGSTGQPKGVILSHMAVTQSLIAHDPLIPQYSRFLQFASPTFDVSMFEIFFTFFRGSTLVGCSRKDLLNDLTGFINEFQVDAAEFTPTVAASLICKRRDVPGLKVLLTIGEMLTSEVIREFGSSDTQSPMLYGMYGPTEAAIHCTLEPGFASLSKTGLIGRPLSTVSAFIAKPVGNDEGSAAVDILPVGHVGELVIGGHQLADGYLNREEKTKSVFLQHETYGPLYRTGDKARVLPNETLECLGRIESGQIKLRGQRIELGEIEQAAMRTKGCRLCIARVIRENLVVFCLVDGEATQHEQIIDTCSKWLLPHMIPNDVVLCSTFPQLPSGKVDKKALDESYDLEDQETAHNPDGQKNTDLINKVCCIAQTVLGFEVGASTDLSRAGLDSIRAIRMASQLRKQGIEINAVDILKAASVRSICLNLDGRRGQLETSKFNDTVRKLQEYAIDQPELKDCHQDIAAILPCTPLQSAMLVETFKDSRAYCNWIELAFAMDLTIDVVQSAFTRLLKTHEILRSGFIAMEASSVGFSQIYWNEHDESQIRRTDQNYRRKFSLETSNDFLRPLQIFVSESSSGIRAVIHLHHALYDGWSIDLVIQDLNTILQGNQIHERPPFRQITEYLLSVLDSSMADDARDYWQFQLTQRDPDIFSEFLPDASRGEEYSTSTIVHELRLSKESLASRDQFHPQVYFEAALSYLWASYLGSSEVMLGCVVSGRTLPIADIENILGPSISTLPLLVEVHESQTIQDVLTAIHETNRQMLEHCVIPLQEVRRFANVVPGQPLFDIVFIWQESVETGHNSSPCVRQVDSADFLESKLLIEVEPRKTSINIKASQRGDILPKPQIEMLLNQIGEIVTSLANLTQAELAKLNLSAMNNFLTPNSLSSRVCDPEALDVLNLNRKIDASSASGLLSCVVSGNSADEDKSILPIGALGTLCIQADGDLDEANETASELLKFNHSKYGPMYLSNCACRMQSDGSLLVLGRWDDFESLGKQRVNLEKISRAIRKHDCVEDCFTIVTEGDTDRSLVSFWVPGPSTLQNGSFVSTDLFFGIALPAAKQWIQFSQEISDDLQRSLSTLEIPSFIIPISTMPEAKDRKSKLAKLYASLSLENYLEHFGSAGTDRQDDPSRDRLWLEREIANALSSSIEVSKSKFGRSTSFFRLGLDSISAISMARTLTRQVEGLKVDVALILRYPTIGQLSAQLLSSIQRSPKGQDDEDSNLISDKISDQLKEGYEREGRMIDTLRICTPLQEGMLATSSKQAYYSHTCFKLVQDASRFRRAFELMINRHDILRTCFSSTEDPNVPFVQVVLNDDFQIPWETIYVSSESIDSSIEDVMNQDLPALDTLDPPFLIKQFESEVASYILLSMHHALYDGEAMAQLLLEVEMVLTGQDLSPAPSFDDFLRLSISQDFHHADAYWDRQFNKFEPHPLPQNLEAKSGRKIADTSTSTFVTSAKVHVCLRELERAAQDFSVTLQTLLQAAWARILSDILGTTDVCFGTVISGRTLPMEGLDRLVAPCFNTLPVRVQLEHISSNEKLLKFLQKTNADALRYQFTPLRRIQSRLNLNGMRLFDTLFILQRHTGKLNASLWSMVNETGDMGFPIVCEMIPDPSDDEIRLSLHASRDTLQQAEAEVLISTFNAALQAIVAAPQTDVVEIDCHELRSIFSTKRQRGAPDDDVVSSSVDEIEHFEGNEISTQVQQALSQLSGVSMDRITPSKTIYQLGLDSISAIQVAKTLRRAGLQVSSDDILEGYTAAGIATLISQKVADPTPAKRHFNFHEFDENYRSQICSQCNIDESQVSIVRPCTQSQAGMISQSMSNGGQTYLNHFLFELDSKICLEELQDAWRAARDKHEMLRTGFGGWDHAKYPFVMIHYSPGKFDLPWNELNVSDASDLKLSSCPLKQLQRIRKSVAEEILTRLDQPAWRLSIAHNDTSGKTAMQLSAHHALYDAESLRLIFDDVISAYEGNILETEFSIEPLLDTILSGEGNDLDSHKAFWQSKLEKPQINKFPNLTPLQVDKRKIKNVSIPGPNLSELEEKCRDLGITIQAALQIAWARLLSEYVGEAEVTFGVVLAGRDSDNADEISFPSTTTVPYRCTVGGDIHSILQDTLSFNSSVRKHQHSALTQIVRWVGCSNSSLFDTLLVYQVGNDDYRKNQLWSCVDEEATVEYPLSLEIVKTEKEDLLFRAVFWDDVIPEQHANLLLTQLVSALKDTVHGQGQGTSVFYLEDQLSQLPPKASEISSDIKTLHGFLEAAAETYSDKVALEFRPSLEDESVIQKWTYRELDDIGNRLAHCILQLGIEPGSLIAVCFEKCPEASFAIVGILKAGCAFVALDPTAPMARKDFIVDDSQASVVLTTEYLAKDMEFTNQTQVLAVDSLELDRLKSTIPTASDQVASSDVCYCLYTSGSTGTPKGCILSHENAVQAILSFQRLFRWNESSRWLQFASFHFDVSVMEQFWSWSVGICVVSTPRDGLFADLPGALQNLNITHIDLTPSLARLVTPEQIPSLCRGVFITGGEPLKQEILDAWGSTGVIHNGYGPTECTIGCTMYPGVPRNGKPSNIGWQFDNVGTYVLEPDTTRIVPKGAVGELCISGKLVGLGYLNRPDTTAESFPFVEKFNEKIYRTKDLVRMLHDGSFEFIGRCDDQVKLRGQRLELGEINNAIKTSTDKVCEAVTIIFKHSESQSEQLVSFVCLEKHLQDEIAEQQSKVINEIKNACRSKLPSYMVPSQIIPLGSIPLTPNNKSDAKKLKEIFETSLKSHSDSDVVDEFDATGHFSSFSKTLAEFLSIPCETVSPSSNVFELGLDSISVFAFCRALRVRGFGEISPGIVMENHTVHDLAKALEQPQPSDSDERQAKQGILACQKKYRAPVARRLGVLVDEVDSIFPCTPLQQGMILRSLENESRPYFSTFVYKLKVSESKVFEAVKDISGSLPILRTVFVPVEQSHVQVVLANKASNKPLDKSFEVIDGQLDESVHSTRCKWLDNNKDVFRYPIHIVRINDGAQSYLVLNIFHGLYDAIGLTLLLQRVASKIQKSQDASSDDPLFQDALPYGPLKKIKEAKSFWKDHMEQATVTPLKSNRNGTKDEPVVATTKIDGVENLEAFRRESGVTHQALAQAAWISVLYNYIQGPTTIGIVVSGRSIPFSGAEKVIGPMFNTIPFFADFSEAETWKSLAQKCHRINVSMLRYQHTPLRDIQKWCRTTSTGPLFDTLFVFQKPVTESSIDTSDLWEELGTTSQPDFPLSLEAEHTADGGLKATIVAQSNVADDVTCYGLLEKFEKNLKLLLSAPDQPVSKSIDTSPFMNLGNDEPSAHVQDNQGSELDGFTWTAEAQSLRQNIAELAGVDISSVNERTSIFELGLDSIDAIKLSSAMKAQNLNLAVSTIIRTPSISQMAGQLSQTEGQVSSVGNNTVDALKLSVKDHVLQSGRDVSNIEEILPATPLQEALVAEMYSSDFKNYFNHDVLQLSTAVDEDRLIKAVETVFADSPIFRTGFLEIGSTEVGCSFAQIIHKEADWAWETIKLSESQTLEDVVDRTEAQMLDVLANAATSTKTPLKLSYVIDDQAKYLVLSISHALYDGWSLALLHADIHRAYMDQAIVRPDYHHVLNDILGGDLEEARNFWRDTVTDTSGCRFPVKDSGEHETQRIHLKENRSSIPLLTIQGFCKDHDIGIQALGHLCWSFLLATYSRNLDVVFGVVLSGRGSEEAQQVMFPTMNTVVVRSILSGSRMEMLKAMQSNIADLMQYQHFPLGRVQAMAELTTADFFNTLFIYQNRPKDSEISKELYKSVSSSSNVEYPVCVEMEIIDDALVWRSACKEAALSENGTLNLLALLDQTLQSVLEQPEASCLDFTGDEISICGLPAFTLAEAHSGTSMDQQHDDEIAMGSKPNADIQDAVRKALSAASKIPESEIRGTDNIFHLGLDSISLIKVSSLLRKSNLRITVSEIMKASTVEKIAAVVEGAKHEQQGNNLAIIDHQKTIDDALRSIDAERLVVDRGITAENIEAILPALPAQVYFLAQWQNTAGRLFSPVFRYQVRGSIGLGEMRRGWNELVLRNPILRTTFVTTSKKSIPLLQVVLRSPPESCVTVSGPKMHSYEPWDMSCPPVRLYVRSSDDKVTELSLYIHHALYDAVSLPLLIRELQELCCKQENLANSSTLQIFSRFLAFSVSPDAMEIRRRFWTQYINSAEDTYSLEAKPSSRKIMDSTERTEFYRPRALNIANEASIALRENGVSIHSVFLAACASQYERLLQSNSRESASRPLETGAHDVVLGVYLANRSHDLSNAGEDENHSLAHLAAPTLNLVPLVVKKPSQTSLFDSAKQIQADLQQISSLENASVGLWEIDEWTGVKIDCLINFLRLPGDDISKEDGGASGITDQSVEEDVKAMPVSIQESTFSDTLGETNESRSNYDSRNSFNTPRALENNAVKDSYLPSWDIEAAARNGALDIGIFGPSEVISKDEAEQLVNDLTNNLKRVISTRLPNGYERRGEKCNT